jgi:hypothetical protein
MSAALLTATPLLAIPFLAAATLLCATVLSAFATLELGQLERFGGRQRRRRNQRSRANKRRCEASCPRFDDCTHENLLILSAGQRCAPSSRSEGGKQRKC